MTMELLEKYTKDGNLQEVQKLISQNPSLLEQSTSQGRHIIHEAALAGHLNIIQYYLQVNPKCITAISSSKANILHYLCRKNHVKAIEYLLTVHKNESISLLQQADVKNETPIQTACSHQSNEAIIQLLPYSVNALYAWPYYRKLKDLETRERVRQHYFQWLVQFYNQLVKIEHDKGDKSLKEYPLPKTIMEMIDSKLIPLLEQTILLTLKVHKLAECNANSLKAEELLPLCYQLMTTLRYKTQRHPWNSESCQNVRLCLQLMCHFYRLSRDEKEKKTVKQIETLLNTRDAETQRRGFNTLLTTAEGTCPDFFYSSYLSDDGSDSEEERELKKQDEKTRSEFVNKANELRKRAEYENFHSRNKSQNPLKTSPKFDVKKIESSLDLDNGRRPEIREEDLGENGEIQKKVEADLKTINDAVKSGKSLKEAEQLVKNGTKFYIAQYRGLHYRTTGWNQTARRKHRKLDERDKPLFCSSVYEAADAYPFHVFYKKDDTIISAKEAELIKKAEELRRVLLEMRKTAAYVSDYSGTPYLFRNLAYMMQDVYSKGYTKFFTFLKDKETWRSLGLLNAGNPFLSTGSRPSHALRYAYGLKYYQDDQEQGKNERLRPRWRRNGQAERPYSGKVYVSLHPLEDYRPDNGPLDVIALNDQGQIRVENLILYEAERSFPSYIEANRCIAAIKAKYPSFHKSYKDIYLEKYGLDRDMYEKFKTALSQHSPHIPKGRYYKRLLGEWLCAYQEVRLIDMAKREAKKGGPNRAPGVLVYLRKDGTLSLTPDPINEIGSPAHNTRLCRDVDARKSFKDFLIKKFQTFQSNNTSGHQEVNHPDLLRLMTDMRAELDDIIGRFPRENSARGNLMHRFESETTPSLGLSPTSREDTLQKTFLPMGSQLHNNTAFSMTVSAQSHNFPASSSDAGDRKEEREKSVVMPVFVDHSTTHAESAPVFPLKDLQRQASSGDIDAQARLGYAYYVGIGTSPNEKSAQQWLQAAVNQNQNNKIPAGLWAQGLLHFMEDIKREEPKKTYSYVTYFQQAAAENYAPAQVSLGMCYLNRTGVQEDLEKAVVFFSQAAAQEYIPAYYGLGKYCEIRATRAKDSKRATEIYKEAIAYYCTAADAGYTWAHYRLGLCYLKGKGGDRDEAKAAKFLRMAADQGNTEAEKALQAMAQQRQKPHN